MSNYLHKHNFVCGALMSGLCCICWKRNVDHASFECPLRCPLGCELLHTLEKHKCDFCSKATCVDRTTCEKLCKKTACSKLPPHSKGHNHCNYCEKALFVSSINNECYENHETVCAVLLDKNCALSCGWEHSSKLGCFCGSFHTPEQCHLCCKIPSCKSVHLANTCCFCFEDHILRDCERRCISQDCGFGHPAWMCCFCLTEKISIYRHTKGEYNTDATSQDDLVSMDILKIGYETFHKEETCKVLKICPHCGLPAFEHQIDLCVANTALLEYIDCKILLTAAMKAIDTQTHLTIDPEIIVTGKATLLAQKENLKAKLRGKMRRRKGRRK